MKRVNKVITSAGPSISNLEINYVHDAIKNGWQSKRNYYLDKFIFKFSKYINLKYCLTTAHCTDAIHLALLSLGIKRGDEVIVPDLTWVASAAPIVYVGAKPVFADVDLNSWCVTAESIEKCITKKTKAVIVVDLLGNMPEWKEILILCRKHNIRIIEDAAEGIGAKYNDVNAGKFGEVSLFSFNATKLIMSGQGGALCTDDKNIFKKAKLISHHGIDEKVTKKYYWSNQLGYNYNWTNIQAALALAQLKRIKKFLKYKEWVFKSYKKNLEDIKNIKLNDNYKSVKPSYWITGLISNPDLITNKEVLIRKFNRYKIDVRPMFYPLSSMPTFKKYVNPKNISKKNPNTYYLSKYGICLPNGYNLDISDIKKVTSVYKKIIKPR